MHSIGEPLILQGNFTMLGFIEGLSPTVLERTVGFHPGRLSSGFAIAAMVEGQQLSPSEIQLEGSTRWSGGFRGSTGSDQGLELEELLENRGQDVELLKKKVCSFFAKRGKNRPAKVVPALKHAPGMQYPDGNAIAPDVRSGIPQFNLLAPRTFSVVSVWYPT